MSKAPWWAGHRGFFVVGCALVPLAVCAALAPLKQAFAGPSAALVLVLVVVGAATSGIRPAGIIAALTGAAGFDYFLTAPYYTLAINDPADIQVAVLLALVGVAVTELALWGRRQQAGASREQGYLDGMLRTAASVVEGRSPAGELIAMVADNIKTLLQADDCQFSAATSLGLPLLGTDGTLTRNGRLVDVARVGLPVDTSIAVPIRDSVRVHGHFVITTATRTVRPNRQQLRIAATMANQLAAPLARVTRPSASAVDRRSVDGRALDLPPGRGQYGPVTHR